VQKTVEPIEMSFGMLNWVDPSSAIERGSFEVAGMSDMPDDTLTSTSAKTTELIELPFGLWTRVGPRKHVLDGAQMPRARGLLLWKGHACHARRHSAVSCAKMAAEIVSLVWGPPGNFNRFRVLAALLHGTLVVGVSQTLRR